MAANSNKKKIMIILLTC